MARPRQFEECEAVDRAMLVFWQKGFAGTSVADLVAVTGLGRQSLYNTFGDKQALFRLVLERYVARRKEDLAPLQGRDAGLSTLRVYVSQLVKRQRAQGCGACLLVRTAFDDGASDPEIQKAVRIAVGRTQEIFTRVLTRAQESGEVSSAVSPSAQARFLFAAMNGANALAQTGATEDEVEATLELAFQSLSPSPSRRRVSPTRSTR